MTETATLSATRHTALPRTVRGLGHLALGLPLCIVAFVVAVAGFAAGAATLVVWVGVPVLAVTLWACRGLAAVERRATEAVLGHPLPPHHYRVVSGRLPGRMLRSLADPQLWRDLLHAVLGFPVRLVTFVVGISWTFGGLAELAYVGWQWSLPQDGDVSGFFGLITGDNSNLGEIVLNTVIGVVMVATSPLVVRGLVAVRAGLARWLLTNENAALRARATTLETSRRAAVDAEAQTLRRVERDIHGGPQQRLVRLNMDLEAVARRLDDDPEKARPLVAEALEQSRGALAELRAVSRGIAPPILADRGCLGPALAAAAARCPVQVTLDVTLPAGRLAPAVENSAYFVVTEALTNVAKHAHAARCAVAVRIDAQRVHLRVEDDGVGGAHPGKGSGLAGLADRLAAVEGTLDVVSCSAAGAASATCSRTASRSSPTSPTPWSAWSPVAPCSTRRWSRRCSPSAVAATRSTRSRRGRSRSTSRRSSRSRTCRRPGTTTGASSLFSPGWGPEHPSVWCGWGAAPAGSTDGAGRGRAAHDDHRDHGCRARSRPGRGGRGTGPGRRALPVGWQRARGRGHGVRLLGAHPLRLRRGRDRAATHRPPAVLCEPGGAGGRPDAAR